MMARVLCGALYGVDAFTVRLEVDYSRAGLPAFSMVGLAEGAVRESRERVFTALRSSGFPLPPARITVNLAPADRKKGGSSYDLPLAVGLLAGAGVLEPSCVEGYYLCAELSLSGELRPVNGVLPVAVLARDAGARGLMVAPENAAEAAVVDGLNVYGPATLGETAEFLAGRRELAPTRPGTATNEFREKARVILDYADVKGQEHAKRAVEIAAAGGHNLLFIGPPGSGKTMLAQRMVSVLPRLTFEEALEVTKIYSVAGLLEPGQGLLGERPFRSPHHTISENGLIGGGAYPRPGEASFAHRGILFLDELLEFRKQTLEMLRQPLEEGQVRIARALHSLCYPADFMLVAAMNPCPCGFLTHGSKPCTCAPGDVQRYRARLSGPLLDRIDLHVEVPAVPATDLQQKQPGTGSAQMRRTIEAARNVQKNRYAGVGLRCNAELSGALLERWCALPPDAAAFLRDAVDRLHLSARAYARILRVARTIADLEGEEGVGALHVAEAVNCRVLDRGLGGA